MPRNNFTSNEDWLNNDYHARHERFIATQQALLKEREAELKKLQAKGYIGADTEKRIKKLQEIVNNIKFAISNMQMQMTLRRPYGL